MARTNMRSTRIKPEVTELLTTRVVRRQRLSPHFARVTLGGGDLDRFRPLGFDQWFRLFLPTAGGTLDGLPDKLTTLSYVRYLRLPKETRPALRAYTVRAYRPVGTQGPEIDVDVVLHGSATDGTAGPGAAWAETCAPGSEVALLDEGVGFNPGPSPARVVLVAEESGLPAAAGILASLPADTRGEAVLEVPTPEDRQDLAAPAGIEVTWLTRDSHDRPGAAALATLRGRALPPEPFYGWAVGEQQLASGARRHWVDGGVSKSNLMFCGYWRA